MKDKYFADEICDVTSKGNEVILSNRLTGRWLKIPAECYEAIKYSVETSTPINKVTDIFEDKDDQNYFNRLIKSIDGIGLLMTNKDSRFEIKFVQKVVFSITNRCNLKCEYCCVDSGSSTGKTDILSTGDVKRAIDNVLKLNPLNLVISGGEPLIREDFYDILEYIKEVYSGKVILCTNATLIKEKDIKKLAKNVYAAEISLDGYDEKSCSQIRGKGVFAKVINNVKLLKENGMKYISLSMVAGEFNEDWVGPFLELNKKLGTRATVRNFSRSGRGAHTYHKYLSDDFAMHYYKMSDFDDMNTFRTNYCWAGSSQLFVNYDGNIYLCPLLQHEEFKICHVFDLNDDVTKRILERNFPAFSNFDRIEIRNISCCKNCKINIFCDVCPAKVYTLLDNRNAFDYNCNFMKKTLMPKIWRIS